jgi:3'(2'), 5'-bisphosphate nucleotidase
MLLSGGRLNNGHARNDVSGDLARREELTRHLCQLAVQAGAAIMRHYEVGTDLSISKKEDNSPVTAADHAAEAVILAGLAQLAHEVPVVSEEQASMGHVPRIEHRFFLVDPLDGTKEFLNRNGEFTVNIALVEDRIPVAGVVFAPAKQRMFFGFGAGEAYELAIDPLAPLTYDLTAARRISARKPSGDGLVVVASRTHRDTKTDEYLSLYKVKEFLAAGSSLKFCLVATGEADLYPRHGRTMEWDTAAGHAVLASAGGSVCQLDGAPLLYGKIERGLDNPFFVARGLSL